MNCKTHLLWLTLTCTFMLSFAIEESETIPYQSFCNPSINDGECSENFLCRCATVVPTGERICTLQTNCSLAISCNSQEQCNKDDSICVVDNRCGGRQLCYSFSLTSPDICPPLATNESINVDV